MRFGLKVPSSKFQVSSSKPRLLANGKRGLQNPYFDLKTVCKIHITMLISCFSRSEFCTLKRALKWWNLILCRLRYVIVVIQLKNLGEM